MKIYLATDHAGFEMKKSLVESLEKWGHEVKDLGACEYDREDDYPDFISGAMRALTQDAEDGRDARAIIFGGSGQGEAMCANRFPGIRAVVYYGANAEIITLSREHNNANVLSIGARFLSLTDAKEAVRLWLETDFTGEVRHQRRIQKLS